MAMSTENKKRKVENRGKSRRTQEKIVEKILLGTARGVKSIQVRRNTKIGFGGPGFSPAVRVVS
jgi:hypothetical protein